MTQATYWTKAEDMLLLELRAAGQQWRRISMRFPGRSHQSCAARWHLIQRAAKRKPRGEDIKPVRDNLVICNQRHVAALLRYYAKREERMAA